MGNGDVTTTQLTSADGTTLAVDSVGQGRPLILIGGAFNDRSTVASLGAELAGDFRIFTYDRRGRVGSDDKSPEGQYAVADEVADLAAVLEHAGGRASVFGHSSGAVLALEGTMAGLAFDKVAVYETPFNAGPDLPHPPAEAFDRLKALVAARDADGATTLFLRTYIGVPEELLAKMQGTPGWTFMTRRAFTLPYDVLLCSPSEPMPAARLAAVTQPLLAVYGDRTGPSLSAATRAVAETVPGAELVAIEGEDHAVLERAGVLAPILARFFD
jgi:pimeloyl-ACP methyl ester carboxylesterase